MSSITLGQAVANLKSLPQFTGFGQEEAMRRSKASCGTDSMPPIVLDVNLDSPPYDCHLSRVWDGPERDYFFASLWLPREEASIADLVLDNRTLRMDFVQDTAVIPDAAPLTLVTGHSSGRDFPTVFDFGMEPEIPVHIRGESLKHFNALLETFRLAIRKAELQY